MKRKITLTLILAAISTVASVSFWSCEKDYQTENNNVLENSSSTKNKLEELSLKEFAASVSSTEEREFLDKTPISDFSSIGQKALSYVANGSDIEKRRIKIRFRWFVGCEKHFGICLIIPFLSESENNTTCCFLDGKCILIPDTEDNGLTTDGYLPLYSNVQLFDNIELKSGIYKAFIDKNTGRTAIAIDLCK